MNAAESIFFVAQVWATIGAVVATAFLLFGIDRIDEDARGAYIFRPLLVPGILLIWPLVLWRWWVLERDLDNWRNRHAPPRRAHLFIAVMFVVAIPLIIAVSWSLRQEWQADFEPVKISLLHGSAGQGDAAA
ncbi:MAG: hypothetical protein OXR62_13960 [Ahrensia sp.]|nr:hypothetical protein [Ahrensia sp.]